MYEIAFNIRMGCQCNGHHSDSVVLLLALKHYIATLFHRAMPPGCKRRFYQNVRSLEINMVCDGLLEALIYLPLTFQASKYSITLSNRTFHYLMRYLQQDKQPPVLIQILHRKVKQMDSLKSYAG
jgi:hypothetical protein